MEQKIAEEKEMAVDIKHRVLVLGAGRVAAPLLEYLSRDPSVKISAGTSLHTIILLGFLIFMSFLMY